MEFMHQSNIQKMKNSNQVWKFTFNWRFVKTNTVLLPHFTSSAYNVMFGGNVRSLKETQDFFEITFLSKNLL